jgi:hypothetical protein
MRESYQRNITTIRRFYAGDAISDEGRREMFADGFAWHVPGDTDLSGSYSGEAYFVDMPARMLPLDEWEIEIADVAANEDLVVASGRVRGRRLGRTLDSAGGHVFRMNEDGQIAEAWGWVADQDALDAFFAEPPPPGG